MTPQPNSRRTTLRDYGAFQVDISTFDTQELAAAGSADRQGMPQTLVQPGNLIERDNPRTKGKKRTPNKSYLLVRLLLVVCVSGACIPVIGYETYNYYQDMSLGQAGIQHLRAAAALLETLPKNPFDAPAVRRARQEFAAAALAFVRVDHHLQTLPGITTLLPVYGSRLSAAFHLVPLAVEVSQAGIAGCNALSLLIARFRDPLDKGQGLTMADLTVLTKDLHQLRMILNLAVEQVNALRPTDLQFDARLGKMLATFHQELPALQAWLDQAEQLLTVAPTLLGIGTPTNYLIELLDSTELRPGGGFMGNYGFMTVSGGRLVTARITDVYLFDHPFYAAGHRIPYPPAYSWFSKYLASKSWSFRDSNLDADFPTAARYAEQNYLLEGGSVPVQGVIAIAPALIQQALDITGPINIPEYHETVTAQNLVERIHYHQLGPGREGSDIPSPDGHSSVRKHFTELLAEHFLARVHELPSSALPRFLQLLVSSLHTKDMQVYFNSSIAENLLQRLRLDASIQSPIGDSFFVVDANVSPNKANQFITNTVSDEVTINTEGDAIHHTTISSTWATDGAIYGSPLYRDYVRVYVPPGSILQMQKGWEPRGTRKVFGREEWAGFFTLAYGQSRIITLIWMVPGAAMKDGRGWHYLYLIQKQAGTHWTLHLQVMLPSCALIRGSRGGLMSSGKNAVLTQSLNQDLNVGTDYTC